MGKESVVLPSIHISDLPINIVQCILKYFSFGTIGKLRIVSKYFNKACSDLLNAEFNRLKTDVQGRHACMKAQMPRRESSRKKHPLADLNVAIEALHWRMILLSVSIGLHVQKNHCCFFAGEILDECKRFLTHIDKNGAQDTDCMTNEIYDLSTMAVEYFKSKIEPTLPSLWCNSESSGSSFNFSLKEPNFLLEPNSLGCDSSLQGLKKSLDDLKKITNGNHRSLLRLKTHVKSMEMDVNNLESVVSEMKNSQKECKLLVNPESDVNNILHKIDQCELMLDSIESPTEPKRLKLKTNSSKNESIENSVNTGSHILGNLHSLSNSQSNPSCSIFESNASSYEELQQNNASTKQTSLLLSGKIPIKRKLKPKIKKIS